LEKAAQKLFLLWAGGAETSTAQLPLGSFPSIKGRMQLMRKDRLP
jgi:hypothetical protein